MTGEGSDGAAVKWAGRFLLVFAGAGLPLMGVAANNQVWLKQSAEVPVVDLWKGGRLTVFVEQEEKFGDRGFIDADSLAMLELVLCRFVTLRLGDRFVYERSRGRGALVPEHRPTFDVDLTTPELLTLKLDFRTRFEWRMIEGETAYMRYRERVRLRTGWNVTRWRFSPFVSEEFFFSDKPDYDASDAFDRNRAQVGFSFLPVPSMPELVCRPYFMVQHDFDPSGWDPINVYGLELSCSF